jgi:hypothetical protein
MKSVLIGKADYKHLLCVHYYYTKVSPPHPNFYLVYKEKSWTISFNGLI